MQKLLVPFISTGSEGGFYTVKGRFGGFRMGIWTVWKGDFYTVQGRTVGKKKNFFRGVSAKEEHAKKPKRFPNATSS